MIWRDFEASAPALAELGRDRFERARVALLGSLRADGTPRISPIGPYLVMGHLLFGVMRSGKTHDLLRDPRCTIHSSVSDPNGADGEFKVYGQAVVVPPDVRDGSYDAWWKAHPPEASHVFSMDIASAVFVGWEVEQGEVAITTWSPDAGVRTVTRPYP